MSTFPMDGNEFGVCLTHDVDRPYKTVQSLYYAISDRRLHHLKSLLPGHNPWWQFEEIMELEDDLGVRSAFYFLREPHLFFERPVSDWLRSLHWIDHVGRYDPEDPEIADVIRALDSGGWEIGVHGSYGSHEKTDRLRYEKESLEGIIGGEIVGGRHHRLHFDPPETWERHREIGLQYDASLGSNSDIGFNYGYDVIRPFDDDFVVFPLTIMEVVLERSSENLEDAWRRCERLLQEARENNAVMTILWHPRLFNETDYPGHRALYREFIVQAQEMNAWIGPPGDLYDRLDHPTADGDDDLDSYRDELPGSNPNEIPDANRDEVPDPNSKEVPDSYSKEVSNADGTDQSGDADAIDIENLEAGRERLF